MDFHRMIYPSALMAHPKLNVVVEATVLDSSLIVCMVEEMILDHRWAAECHYVDCHIVGIVIPDKVCM